MTTIPRYIWRSVPEPGTNDPDYGPNYLMQCWDYLTGKCVVSYDLGDPANYDPNYGGWSCEQWLEARGLDPRERIEAKYNIMEQEK